MLLEDVVWKTDFKQMYWCCLLVEYKGCRYEEAACEGKWMCFASFVLGRLSGSVLVSSALTRCESELLFPAPPYSPTLHLQCSFYQQQSFLLNPRILFSMLHFYSLILFSSLRAPPSEISKKISTHFHLLLVTLKIPVCMSCLWN